MRHVTRRTRVLKGGRNACNRHEVAHRPPALCMNQLPLNEWKATSELRGIRPHLCNRCFGQIDVANQDLLAVKHNAILAEQFAVDEELHIQGELCGGKGS